MNYQFSQGLPTQMGRKSRAKGMIIIGLIGGSILLPLGILLLWGSIIEDEIALLITGLFIALLGLVFLVLGIVNIFIMVFLKNIRKSDSQQAKFIKYQRDELGLYSHIEYEFTDKYGQPRTNKEHLGYYPGVFTRGVIKEIEKTKRVPVKVYKKRALIDILPLIDGKNEQINQVFHFCDEDED